MAYQIIMFPRSVSIHFLKENVLVLMLCQYVSIIFHNYMVELQPAMSFYSRIMMDHVGSKIFRGQRAVGRHR